ncbi:MAG: helix-turn-helix domain-containing protein [Kurthia sp.]|nr:helix-turn-helix domain-containing protein [Candidatus Kurthia equi]
MSKETSMFYTKEEVSSVLGIAESTVYSLAKSNQIECEVLPTGVSRPKRYLKDSVDTYKIRHLAKPEGLSIQEFALKHKISTQRVYQLIKKLHLGKNKATIDKRSRLIISPEDEALIVTEMNKKSHKGTKSDFYKYADNIALFQLFINPLNDKYRIIRNSYNVWGVNLSVTGEFLPFKEAVKQLKLQPAYTIHQNSLPSSMYVKFRFSTSDPEAYVFLDICYEMLGIENIHLLHKERLIELSIKAVPLQLQGKAVDVTHLNTSCLNAVGTIDNDELHFNLEDRPITIVLKGDSYKMLKSHAASERMSLSDMVNELIQKHLVSQNTK